MPTTRDFSRECGDSVEVLRTLNIMRHMQQPGTTEFKATLSTISKILDSAEQKTGLDSVIWIIQTLIERFDCNLPLNNIMLDKLSDHGYTIIVSNRYKV